ncbi:MAG: hypothetical protein JEZ00_05930, partial [Anaerolineaceae bacterium]|nr:hypothetical protein [Anaerolineaceae bacterium]
MTNQNKFKLFHFLLTFVLVIGFLFPTGAIVSAEDTLHPESTEETVNEVQTTTDSVATEEINNQLNSLEATNETTNEASIETVVSNENEPPTDEGINTTAIVQTPEEQGAEAVLSDNPTGESISSNVEQKTDNEQIGQTVENRQSETEEPIDGTLIDEVEALSEVGAVLMDENNESIPLASTLAKEVLTNADPYFTRGGATYNFYQAGGTCPAGDLNVTCFISSTPIQDAIDMYSTITPLSGEDATIYVLPGNYEENITIAVADLTLMGDPGDESIAGASVYAPVLQGTSGTGITINAEGVTISGFIIRGFDTGILVSVASGNNDINILNNTVTENSTGIQVSKFTGSPGTEIHYNQLYGNTDFGLVNNIENNNVQFVEAQNNFWGCEVGPVVFGAETTGRPSNRRSGYWQYPTGEFLGNTLPDGCELLNGLDDMWDFQFNTPDWSPFKINLDEIATITETETPEQTTQTPEPTTTTPEPTTQTPEPTTTTP